jgi:hypothetical protein
MLVLIVFCVSLALATGVAGRALRALAHRPWPRTRRLAAALADAVGVRLSRPEPPDEGVELLICTLELQRLSRTVQRAHATDQPGKFERVRASEGAYDDVLLRTCRVAGVGGTAPVPDRGPLSTMQRFEVETALMAGGVHW